MTFTLKKESEGEFGYIDNNGFCHNSPQAWLWSILGGCGCGSSDDFAEEAWKLLDHFSKPHLDRKMFISDDPFKELLAHWMHGENLLEHGSSIGGSWLSKDGEEIHAAIKALLA